MGRLCQQRWLLAELVLLCLFLPLILGTAAQQVLTQGVDFSGIRLAVTAPEGDELPQLLEQYMGQMQDVSRYCTVEAMEEDEALAALEAGTVTAVLKLPEQFAQGITGGTNPDVQVIVGGEQPLAALLALWVGQSATDLLAAVQAGIYAVLDLYEAAPPAGMTWDQAMMEINLKYISWMMGRQGMFRLSEVSAAGALPVKEHYGVCLLAYFALALAPLFARLYQGDWLRSQRRLRAAGRTGAGGYAASVLASWAVLLLLMIPGLALTAGRISLPLLGAAAVTALFAAVFASFCCLLTANTAGCGVLAFLVSLLSLALAGGILPPVLLPRAVQAAGAASPVSWLRNLAGRAMGYETPGGLWPLILVTAALMALSCCLYCLRLDGKGAEE